MHLQEGKRLPRVFRSGAEWCAWNFPKAHRLGTCPCKEKDRRKVLVIRSRHQR